jgi:hypothetical protein
MMEEDKRLCPKCNKNPQTKPHACPFASEIDEDNNPEYCTCCEECEHECAMDI